MTLIPGTKVQAAFIDVAEGGHPPIYYRHGEAGPVITSLNAGNTPTLKVGLGGINGLAFAPQLQKAVQNIAEYESRHVALAAKAPVDGTETETYGEVDPCAISTLANTRLKGPKDNTGLAFVDVFADGYCPGGNTANRSTLYVAPPEGWTYSDDASFLTDVTKTGESIVKALDAYNTSAEAQNSPRIEALRMCMYSSNNYKRDGVAYDAVALAIFDGLSAGLMATGLVLKEVQMPAATSPGGEQFFAAVKAKLGS